MESEGLTLAVDAADTGQGMSTSECGQSSCEQTAREILPVENIVQGEMFHQRDRILSEESQGSVESDRLSTLDPLIHNDMPASPPQNHRVALWDPIFRVTVSFEEAIRRLNESQPETLRFQFEGEVDGYDEAYKEHRHQFIDAVSTCESLKELTIHADCQKLSIEEVQLLCQNLLPALNSLELDGLLDNDGVEIVCEKMANNCALKNLSLEQLRVQGRESSAGASLRSMLAKNSTLDSLNLSRSDLGPNGVEALLQPLTGHATDPPLNKSLTHLIINDFNTEMGQGDGEAIAHMLRTNDTLTHFDISGCELEPSDVCKILQSLQKNQTLLHLELFGCEGVKGPDVSAKMMDLFRMNRSLTHIDLADTPLEQSDVCKILESLQKNQTLCSLRLHACQGVKGPDVLAKMMDLFQMNRSLRDIDLDGTPLEQSDVCQILESLQKNQTLRHLNLSYCQGVKGPDVLAKMMDLVRMHPSLMEIRLDNTPLQREGQAAQVQAQLENNAKDYMAVLRGMPRVPPKFVRVFLCGNAYSGNSAFSLSLIFLFCNHYLHLWNCLNHINAFVMTPQWCLIQFQHSHTYSFLNLNHMSFEKKLPEYLNIQRKYIVFAHFKVINGFITSMY
jgi:hypothetical protein